MKYAVVDLEATEANTKTNQIIQIGIVLIEQNVVTKTYQTLVNPNRPLSETIKALTGITDEQLAQAPQFSEVAQEVVDLLEGAYFVAHNVKFDYHLLEKMLVACGKHLACPRIDTVELARIVYPGFEKYGLESLSDQLSLSHDRPHEALSDALVTAKLLLLMQAQLQQLPQVTLASLVSLAGHLTYETGLFIEAVYKRQRHISERYVSLSVLALRRPDKSQTRKHMSQDFAHNMKRLGLIPKPDQLDLVNILTRDYDLEVPSFVEAATGIGKTHAYLLTALTQDRPVIIATATKQLQDQLMQEFEGSLRAQFGVKLVKCLGRSNYISLSRFAQFLASPSESSNQAIFKMKVLVWLCQTTTGELDELSRTLASDAYFEAIAKTASTKEALEFQAYDFYDRVKQASLGAQVSVYNQALLIDQLLYHKERLDHHLVIIDEAQQLVDTLEQKRQISIDMTDVLNRKQDQATRLEHRLIARVRAQLKASQPDNHLLSLDLTELGFTDIAQCFKEEYLQVITNGQLLVSPKNFLDLAALTQGLKLVLIGATLSLSEDKPIIPELLGFKHYRFDRLPSPKIENQSLFVVTDGLSVSNSTQVAYADYLADQIQGLANLALPMLVLFTSQEMQMATYQALNQKGLNPLVQDGQIPPAILKQKYQADDGAILLGLGSFWEGVDMEVHDRQLLVITRLPFSTPDDLLTKKYARRYANPFYDFNVPRASLKLIQAMGRVNRRSSQKSAVVVLDKRLAGKTYAKRMRRTLEDKVTVTGLQQADLVERVDDFFDR